MTLWVRIIVAASFCVVAEGLQAQVSHTRREVIIKVDGMFCPFCTYGVEKRLRKLGETEDVRIDLAAGEAIVTLKPAAKFIEAHFDGAIKKAGFTHSGITVRAGHESLAEFLSTSAGSLPGKEISHTPPPFEFAYQKTIGQRGRGPGQFEQPMGIAFAMDGSFVVADAGNARIQQFHQDGSPWRQWTTSGDGRTLLVSPTDVAIGPAGDVWAVDYGADSVNRYSSTGEPKGRFGESGSRPGQLDAPAGIALTSAGLIAVADFYNSRLQLFTSGGTFQQNIEGLNYPTKVTVDEEDMLWVADAYNHRVVAFSAGGSMLQNLGKNGQGSGEFDVSAGIALLAKNRIAAADFMNHRVHFWSRDGKFLGDIGAQGSGNDEFERPVDAEVSPNGLLFVVDWGNNRLQVYGETDGRR